MRNLIILFFICSFSLSSEERIESSKEYIRAISFYKINNYKKSYTIFKKLFNKNFENININYYLALNEMKLKKYSQSYASLERILIKEPLNFNGLYELARLYYLTSKNKKSYDILNNLRKTTISKNKIRKIDKLLKKIKKEQKTFYLKGNVLIGGNKSDNVNNGISEKFSHKNILYGEERKSDYSLTYLIDLNFIKTFVEQESISLKNNIIYMNKLYSNEKEENNEFYGYFPSVVYSHEKSFFSVGPKFSRYQPGYKDSYLYFDSIGLQTKYIYTNNKIKLSAERFFNRKGKRKNRNYTRYRFMYNLYNINNFDLGFDIRRYLAFKSSKKNLNRVFFKTSLAYNHDIYNTNIKAKVDYQKVKYNNKSAFFKTKRIDNRIKYSLIFKKNLYKKNTFLFDLAYLKNNSNQKAYKYDERNFGFKYIKTFNF